MSRTTESLLAVLGVLVALALLAELAAGVIGAPVPAARPEKPVLAHELCGGWVFRLSEEYAYTIVLSSDGTQWNSNGESVWVGRWSLDGGRLVVLDRPLKQTHPGLSTWMSPAVTRDRRTGLPHVEGLRRAEVPRRPSSGVNP